MLQATAKRLETVQGSTKFQGGSGTVICKKPTATFAERDIAKG